MEADARRITRHISRYYDRELVAKVDGDKICIFRKNKRWIGYNYNGVEFYYPHPVLDYIMALTDNWSLSGTSRIWGLDFITNRLKQIDGWANPNFIEDIEKANERVDELKRRRLKSEAECFAKEIRPAFAKAFDGVNTSTLEKIDRRRIDERKIKNGYR